MKLKRPWIGVVLVLWLTIAAAASAGLVRRALELPPDLPNRELEILKFGLGLLQSVVIGGIAALILEGFKNARAREARATDRRREWSQTARSAYDEIKLRRRLIQDELGKAAPSVAACQGVDSQLVEHGVKLISSQLRLEYLVEQAEHSLDSKEKAVVPVLRQLERNLNNLSDALRNRNRNANDAARIDDFINKEGFGRDFGEPYHKAVATFLGAS